VVDLWVNALAAKTGGGLSVLLGLAKAFSQAPGLQLTVVSTPETIEQLTPHVPGATFRTISVPSPLARLRIEQRITREAEEARATALLNLSNFGNPLPTRKDLIVGLLVQNVAPLDRETRKRYRGQRRLRLEVLRTMTRRSSRRSDVVFTFSHYAAGLVSQVAGGTRTITIPPGLPPDLDVQPIDRKDDYVLVLSDLYRYKGMEDAIVAFAGVRQPDLRLVICGRVVDPNYRRHLDDVARRAGVQSRVDFLGATPHADAMALMKGAKCLLQTSRIESLCLPLLEAAVLGVPVISTDIPVAREIAGNAVVYYPIGHTETLRTLLDGILANPPEPLPPEQFKDRFSWDLSASQILDALAPSTL
jgi:glycosyltransferase involved in cell wall biosynthesis